MISMELEMDFDQLRGNQKVGIRSTQKRDNFQDDSNDNCFLVFIGGKYVRVLDQIMKKVENISQKIGLLPLGLFVTSPVENTMNTKAAFPLVKFMDVYMLPLMLISQVYNVIPVDQGTSFCLQCPG